MTKTIDMQHMRYINLFRKISRISPHHCFCYNNIIIFVVAKKSLRLAIGNESRNLRKLNQIIGRKVRVVIEPIGIEDAEQFVSTIIAPAEIKNIEIEGNSLIINAGGQNKAILIGRNKSRFEEMKKIIKEYFEKELKIV